MRNSVFSQSTCRSNAAKSDECTSSYTHHSPSSPASPSASPIHMRFSAVEGFKKKELTQWAIKHLRPSSLVVSDGLACFRGVEEAKNAHLAIVTGGGPASVKLPYFKWVNTMIGNVKNAMHGTYHAINQKHLPRYLAEFCFKFNHRFNLESMIMELVRIGCRTAPMPQRLLKLAESRW